MTDEFGKPFEFCLSPFGADDPIRCHPLVPRGLGTEEFPGGFVGAKLLFLCASETGALSLFVGVDARFFFVASGESFEAGWMHQPLLGELSNEVDVDGTPVARGFAGSEANCVTVFVEALSNAVDPAEAQRNLDGFGPGSEVRGRWEECWFWRHGGSLLILEQFNARQP